MKKKILLGLSGSVACSKAELFVNQNSEKYEIQHWQNIFPPGQHMICASKLVDFLSNNIMNTTRDTSTLISLQTFHRERKKKSSENQTFKKNTFGNMNFRTLFHSEMLPLTFEILEPRRNISSHLL